MNFWNTFAALFSNFGALTWQMVVMWGIGALLIYLAIVKKMGPTVSPCVMAPDAGRLTRMAPNPMGSSRLGSIFLTMAR